MAEHLRGDYHEYRHSRDHVEGQDQQRRPVTAPRQ